VLTPQGFKRKRYEDWFAELEAKAKELWGANVNLSDRSNLGKFVKLLAYVAAEKSELAEDVYNSAFKDTAEGVSLQHVGKYIGISKLLGNKAEVTLVFQVDPGVSIPAGVVASTVDGIEFVTEEAGTESGGIVRVKAKARVPGASGNVPAGTITQIVTPRPGVLSVANPEPSKNGRDEETEPQFRERYDKSVAKGGSSTIESIRAALLELPGVKDADVDENEDLNTNERGIPGKSIAPFVYGGDDVEIAQTIFSTKTGGIRSWGSIQIPVVDSMGKQHIIGFSRPIEVPVWVRITLTRNATYPADGDAQVRKEVIKYIGGRDTDGTEYDGLDMGSEVVLYKVIAAAGSVPGIDDLVVELSTDGTNYSISNIPIDTTSIATTTADKVVIV
jgi:uncharacterized phage protein gp47/JayE